MKKGDIETLSDKRIRGSRLIGAIVMMTLLLVGTLLVTVGVSGQEQSDITIYVDGDKVVMDTVPVIHNNRTLVPLRGVFEKLGADVDYNIETKQVIVKTDLIEVLLETENDAVLVNGRISHLDTASMIVDDRTLVPVRFVAEALGHEVAWNGLTRRIDITTKDVQIDTSSGLPTVGSFENLAQLIKYNNDLSMYISGRRTLDVALEAVTFDTDSSAGEADVQEEAPMEKKSESASADDASSTNTQVEGVDEGDILKTDGSHIFFIPKATVYLSWILTLQSPKYWQK